MINVQSENEESLSQNTYQDSKKYMIKGKKSSYI